MRATLLFFVFIFLLPTTFAQSAVKGIESNHLPDKDRTELLLDKLSMRMSASVETVASKCAMAAAPACVSAIAAIPPSPAPEMDKRSIDGLYGDYIGGIFGTIIAGITMIAVLMAWWSSRKIDYKSKTYQVFAEMLRTHEEIVSSIRVGNAQGRDAIGYILSEFGFVYKLTQLEAENAGWTLEERIDIAYTYTYYGPQLHTIKVLGKYNHGALTAIGNGLSKKARTTSVRKKGRDFKGHQNRLSHYFRNLFSAYSFIESSKLSRDEKKDLGKVLRAKLSNYEQGLLTLNMLSHLGKKWKSDGLIDIHMPIRNVPEHFFSFDEKFNLKEQFPRVQFEWELGRVRIFV